MRNPKVWFSADIRNLAISLRNGSLIFEIGLLSKPKQYYEYHLSLISFYDQDTKDPQRLFLVIKDNRLLSSISRRLSNVEIPGISYDFSDTSLTITVPAENFKEARMFMVNAATYKNARLIDRTGFRYLTVESR